MFKIALLEDTKEEKIKINKIQSEIYYVKTKKDEVIDILEFEIEGKYNNDIYNFSFNIEENINNYLEYPKLERINLKDKIREACFDCNEKQSFPTLLNIEIIRCTASTFNIAIILVADFNNTLNDNCIVSIEFSFNIDEYLDGRNATD